MVVDANVTTLTRSRKRPHASVLIPLTTSYVFLIAIYALLIDINTNMKATTRLRRQYRIASKATDNADVINTKRPSLKLSSLSPRTLSWPNGVGKRYQGPIAPTDINVAQTALAMTSGR